MTNSRRGFVLLIGCFLAMSGISCRTSDSGDQKEIISLRVPDSLKAFNPVLITTHANVGSPPLDTLWNGPLPDPSRLARLESPLYKGGSLCLWIQGMRRGHMAYSVWVEYDGSTGKVTQSSILSPDTTPPAIFLSGPDTVRLETWYLGKPVAELLKYASCLDDRDSPAAAPVINTGPIPIRKGNIWFMAEFQCIDLGGNKSIIMQKPFIIQTLLDRVPPVMYGLDATDTVGWPYGLAYSDTAIRCEDDFDGPIPATLDAPSDIESPGLYHLRYSCTDSASNRTESDRWLAVTRDLSPTEPAPVIKLSGEDTVPLNSLASYLEPGAVCREPGSGADLAIKSSVPIREKKDGYFRIEYSCAGKSYKRGMAIRVLNLGWSGIRVVARAETMIDTDQPLNYGSTGFLPLRNRERDTSIYSLIRWPLSLSILGEPKSAKLRFSTYCAMSDPDEAFGRFTFRLFRLRSDWEEGRGDLYYYGGAFRNGGENLYRAFPRPDLAKTWSLDPSDKSGVANEFAPWLRPDSLDMVLEKTFEMRYHFLGGNPPEPGKLTDVELDISGYIRSGSAAIDSGFVVEVTTPFKGNAVYFATKELGNSAYPPLFIVEFE